MVVDWTGGSGLGTLVTRNMGNVVDNFVASCDFPLRLKEGARDRQKNDTVKLTKSLTECELKAWQLRNILTCQVPVGPPARLVAMHVR